LFSLIGPLRVAPIGSSQTTTVTNEAGQMISETVTHGTNPFNTIVLMILIFAIYNIPTLLLLLVYGTTRAKQKRHTELTTMNIHDL